MRIRVCPAAVDGNKRWHEHWTYVWEASVSRSDDGRCRVPTRPKTCQCVERERSAVGDLEGRSTTDELGGPPWFLFGRRLPLGAWTHLATDLEEKSDHRNHPRSREPANP